MPPLAEVAAWLQQLAPLALAESWDNVGLLVGDPTVHVDALMTCLTVTPASAAEAIAGGAQLIVTHHPLPFRPLKRLTTDTPEGFLLWQLMRAGVAIYSAHTAFDSAATGINQAWAQSLALRQVAPLIPTNPSNTAQSAADSALGSGRMGLLDQPLSLFELAAQVRDRLGLARVQVVGPSQQRVQRVGIACGSAAELMPAARAQQCDVLISGEMRFHSCLEAEALGLGLVLVGHFASERFAMQQLATQLGQRFPQTRCWCCHCERDPLQDV